MGTNSTRRCADAVLRNSYLPCTPHGPVAPRRNKPAPTRTKLRGGYYTPPALAEYLCRWAIRSTSDRVLEPSCGDGNFVSASASILDDTGEITAAEIVPDEIEKAKAAHQGLSVPVTWHCASFFDVAPFLFWSGGYDAVVGNPPFIRFQYFDKSERNRAFRLVNQFGYRPNGLANAWVVFVQAAIELLREGGRVVPAELLQVTYAAELRGRLPSLFDDVYLIAFDELVFPEIQQEVVLLLGDGRRREGVSGKLHTIEMDNGDALLERRNLGSVVSHLPERHSCDKMKWTSLFLADEEFDVLRACGGHASGSMSAKAKPAE